MPDELDQAGREAVDQVVVEDTAQRNFTDPQARIKKTTTGIDYAYSGQAFVDDTTQVIIAVDMTQQATDVQQSVPMQETKAGQLRAAGIEADPVVSLADAGYCSNGHLTAACQFQGPLLIGTGRQ